jgi:hypothetical protein
MMGTSNDAQEQGIVPRLCSSIFNYIKQKCEDDVYYKVEVSYMEIYNEKVRDLLDPDRCQLRHLQHSN